MFRKIRLMLTYWLLDKEFDRCCSDNKCAQCALHKKDGVCAYALMLSVIETEVEKC